MNFSAFAAGRLLSRKNEKLSREAFERQRLVRFRKFAAFIQQHSPWYRRVMSEHKIDPAVCLPEHFPVLTKTEVIEHFDEITTARDVTRKSLDQFLHRSKDPKELFQGKYTVIHTSGSSGEVGFFVYDKPAWARVLSQVASGQSFRLFSFGRQKVAFFGATQGHFAGVSMSLSTSSMPFSLVYKTRTFEVNRPLAETVKGLNKFQPDMVLGYGSALKELAEKQIKGELRISPELLVNSGEPLVSADLKVIEGVFGKCIKNAYACSEHGLIGLREPSWKSMRLLEDYIFFDIFDDHVLTTNISNRVLPLIRYRMNDVLTLLPSQEHAPYRSISDVVGRVEQIAKFTNRHGEVDGISPHTINELLIPHVKRFQMRLRGPELFEFAVVFDSSSNERQREDSLLIARQKLGAILREKDMENVAFDVVAVENLPVDLKSGKFRLIMATAS